MTDCMMPPVDPIGGSDDPERPTDKIDGYNMAGVGRDAQTDDRSISDAEGKMSDELDMSGWLCDSRVTTIGDEKRAQGWQPTDKPVGAMPKPQETSGSRGAADIGRI